MRAANPGGRFTIQYEIDSIRSGISADLRRPVGQTVQWYVYDPEATQVDPVYDVGAAPSGRRWKSPRPIPAVSAVIMQGQTVQSDRGFYQTDIARFVFNIVEISRALPDISSTPDPHIRDRIVYRGNVFTPTHFDLRGLLTDRLTIVTVDANQLNPEELLHDTDFAAYAR